MIFKKKVPTKFVKKAEVKPEIKALGKPVHQRTITQEIKSNDKVYILRYHMWDTMANMHLVESVDGTEGSFRMVAAIDLGCGGGPRDWEPRIKWLMTHIPSLLETVMERAREGATT